MRICVDDRLVWKMLEKGMFSTSYYMILGSSTISSFLGKEI